MNEGNDEEMGLEISRRYGVRLVQDHNVISGHAACAVGGTLIVWGGYTPDDGYRDARYIQMLCLDMIDLHRPIWVKVHCDGGEPPHETSGASMVFALGHLVLFGGHVFERDEGHEGPVSKCVNRVYKLNMRTMLWKRVTYEDNQMRPTPRDKGCAWNYCNRVFFFSGYGDARKNNWEISDGDFLIDDDNPAKAWNSQLLEFDLKTETWHYYKTFGASPSPRAAAASCIVEDQVFVFGGRTANRRLNDLYRLDMNSLIWTNIQLANMPQEDIVGRSWASICVTEDLSRCYIWGGHLDGMDNVVISAQVIEGDLVNNKWMGCTDSFNERYWHVGALRNGMLSVVGGYASSDDENPPNFECMRVQPPSLKFLAFNQITLRGTRRTYVPPDWEKRLYLRALLRGCPAHVTMFENTIPLEFLQLASLS